MINQFLQTYGFDGIKGFLLSLFPSFKYGIAGQTISISAVFGVVASWLGMSPFLIPVMLMAVLVETWTGFKASKKQGGHFESVKFSRCVIKVFIWVFLFFVFHSFAMDMHSHEDNWIYLVGAFVLDAIHVTAMVYFVMEYTVSILENLAVLDGKPKETLVVAIGAMFDSMVDKLKGGKK